MSSVIKGHSILLYFHCLRSVVCLANSYFRIFGRVIAQLPEKQILSEIEGTPNIGKQQPA